MHVSKQPANARIQAIREEKEMSRECLANKLETTRLQIWRIETGKTKLLADDLPRFARALGVDVAELVG